LNAGLTTENIQQKTAARKNTEHDEQAKAQSRHETARTEHTLTEQAEAKDTKFQDRPSRQSRHSRTDLVDKAGTNFRTDLVDKAGH
jgi:hypothetical protein